MQNAETITPTLKTTFAIRFTGIVQGVGFRPFVYRTAKQFGVKGFVRNDNDGVYIEADGSNVEAFYQYILANAPQQAKIISHSIQKTTAKNYIDFTIAESGKKDAQNELFITPDFALCPRCKAELYDTNNRRFHYPFITCTDCGTRYSITEKLPFDRENTAMKNFQQCTECLREYNDANDIRFYSQTNSCKKCSVQMQLFDANRNEISGDSDKLISFVVAEISYGKIVAVKGIGGFLLLCDATNESAIKILRGRKHRPTKPFAVMYPTLAQIENDYVLRDIEKEALQSAAAPIVLLQRKNETTIALNEVAPNLNRVGVFLPYAPLLELILSQFAKPVIATSANISGGSIIYDNEKALADLPQFADFILLHNREIIMPQDDSVVQFSAQTETKIILRNGRGFAPAHFTNCKTEKTIFSSGALLKSSFALAHNGSIYVSQYLGNTSEYDAQQTYEKVVQNFLKLTNAPTEAIVCDIHPDYFATMFAKQKANELNIRLEQVQHHKAHFAAVLAENNLIDTNKKNLGVVWDGTGLGDDGQIWGGEFFMHENEVITRVSHFEYAPNISGDKMAKEPRISALAFSHGLADEILKSKFTQEEWNYYTKLTSHNFQLSTSSCGRLFDAVASLLSLSDKQNYEGEAALLLENLAFDFWEKKPDFSENYIVVLNENIISVQTIIAQIIDDLKNEISKEKVALKFHLTLVKIITEIALQHDAKHIAFSGGVFQNALLVDLIKQNLSSTFDLYFHQKLSPNDENIAFGQMVLYFTQYKNM